MFVSVFDFPNLIYEILRSRKEMLDIDGVFWFRLKGCPRWSNDSFRIQIRESEVSVVKETDESPEIVIAADMSALISCILGTENILKAVITSKVHFRPFRKIRKFVKLFSLLQIRYPWFRHRADVR